MSTKPSQAHLALRAVLPRVETNLRQTLAYPNQPSNMTSFGDAAYARNYQGQPQKNWDAGSLIMLELTKTKPTELKLTKSEEDMMKMRQQMDFARARTMQAGRVGHDPNIIERILGGMK